MTPKELNDALLMISEVCDIYYADINAIFIGHDLAHSILLYGRIRRECDELVSWRVDKMSVTRSNDHEMKTVALHLAALRALKQPDRENYLIKSSYGGLAKGSRKYSAYADYKRAVLAYQPARRHIQQFVRTIRTFVGYL